MNRDLSNASFTSVGSTTSILSDRTLLSPGPPVPQRRESVHPHRSSSRRLSIMDGSARNMMPLDGSMPTSLIARRLSNIAAPSRSGPPMSRGSSRSSLKRILSKHKGLRRLPASGDPRGPLGDGMSVAELTDPTVGGYHRQRQRETWEALVEMSRPQPIAATKSPASLPVERPTLIASLRGTVIPMEDSPPVSPRSPRSPRGARLKASAELTWGDVRKCLGDVGCVLHVPVDMRPDELPLQPDELRSLLLYTKKDVAPTAEDSGSESDEQKNEQSRFVESLERDVTAADGIGSDSTTTQHKNTWGLVRKKLGVVSPRSSANLKKSHSQVNKAHAVARFLAYREEMERRDDEFEQSYRQLTAIEPPPLHPVLADFYKARNADGTPTDIPVGSGRSRSQQLMRAAYDNFFMTSLNRGNSSECSTQSPSPATLSRVASAERGALRVQPRAASAKPATTTKQRTHPPRPNTSSTRPPPAGGVGGRADPHTGGKASPARPHTAMFSPKALGPKGNGALQPLARPETAPLRNAVGITDKDQQLAYWLQ